MTKQRRAEWLLVLTTAFWGVSYYLTDVCFAELDPLNLNAIRFVVAFVVLGAIYRKHFRGMTRETLRYGALVGVTLVFAYIGATYGVKYTSLSNAGFISCLAGVITPVLELIVYRRKPENKVVATVLLCTLGLALMTLGPDLSFAAGDLICLLCSVAYSIDILITDRAVANEAVDPVGMSVVEIGVTGAGMLALSLLFERPRLPHTAPVWAAALFLGIFCSGVAFVLQTTQQRYSSATRVALIFTLEPVFSAIVAYFLAGERLHPRAYLGAALMVLSIALMQIDLKGGKTHDDVRQSV